MNNDELIIQGHKFNSRFILGSGKFSLQDTKAVLENGGVEMATLAVRRANVGGEENILDYIPKIYQILVQIRAYIMLDFMLLTFYQRPANRSPST